MKSSDNGDRDNLMQNDDFATFFLSLCKMLPLWSSINCKFFNVEVIPSSSANAESYYNDLKCSLASNIPGRVEEFVQDHIKLIRGMVKNAALKYITFIDTSHFHTSNNLPIATDIAPNTDLEISEKMDEIENLLFISQCQYVDWSIDEINENYSENIEIASPNLTLVLLIN